MANRMDLYEDDLEDFFAEPNETQKQTKSRVLEIRKKRRARYVRIFLTIILIGGIVLAYMLGALNTPMELAQQVIDDIIISMEQGDGFPVERKLHNFVNAQQMQGGVALIETDEFAIYSAKGNMLRTVPHSYANPVMSVGGNNVCIYAVGGSNLTVESRTQTLHKKEFESPILLAHMSSNDKLAVFTESQLEVFDADFNTLWSWQTPNIIPLDIEFSTDNKNFAVATLNSSQGAAHCDIRLFHLNKGEAVAQITAQGVPLAMHYNSNEFTVVFDTYTATYDVKTGAELGRYTYPFASIIAADIAENGNVAILFGDENYPSLTSFVLLDDEINMLYSKNVSYDAHFIKIVANNVYLLYNEKAEKYDVSGELLGQALIQDKPFDIVDASDLLYITQNGIFPLDMSQNVV